MLEGQIKCKMRENTQAILQQKGNWVIIEGNKYIVKPEHGVTSGALDVVLVKFVWCTPPIFMPKTELRYLEWYECYKANRCREEGGFDWEVFSGKKRIRGHIVEDTLYNSLPVFKRQKNQMLLWVTKEKF